MPTKLTWHGHANFQIEASGKAQANVLIDPFFSGNPKATVKWRDIPRPDLVLVTHLHGDHAGDSVKICNFHGTKLGGVVGVVEKLAEAGLDPALILNGIGFNIGGTVTHQGIRVTMTEAFHTSEGGVPVGYIITLPDGFTIYHAGDTGIFRNMQTWGELYPIDLALLPAGGTFTMDARQAALAAKFLGAKAAVPMHWGTFPVLAQDALDFERELALTAPDCRPLVMQPGETVNL